MWDKLLALFKDKSVTDNIQSAVPQVESQPTQINSSMKSDGKSTHIGYNYLKGLGDDEDSNNGRARRFINLNRLLRGDYDGKITATDEESEADIRRTDT